MIVYTVHEPPDAPVDRVDRADTLKFIGDRFSPVATALGPLWLLANRLWVGLAIYLAAAAVIGLLILAAGLHPGWLSLMVSGLNLILGFEAPSLQRWTLERRGWRTLGTVSGRNVEECERRFLEGWLSEQRMSRQDEFVATVNALRGAGGGLAKAAAAGSNPAGGRLSTGTRGRGWLRWRRGG